MMLFYLVTDFYFCNRQKNKHKALKNNLLLWIKICLEDIAIRIRILYFILLLQVIQSVILVLRTYTELGCGATPCDKNLQRIEFVLGTTSL